MSLVDKIDGKTVIKNGDTIIVVNYDYLQNESKGKCPKCNGILERIEEYDSIEITDQFTEECGIDDWENTVDKEYGQTILLRFECANPECDFKFVEIGDKN